MHFADLDSTGELSSLFAGPSYLTPAERHQVETEEGWTLGVDARNSDQRNLAAQTAKPQFTVSTLHVEKQARTRPGESTRPGYINRNRQTVVRPTGLAGTDHCQSVYVLRCGICSREYGANGSDIWLRLCPFCREKTCDE